MKKTRPEWEVWLWLSTEGEVRAAKKMPEGGPDDWLGFVATPPLDAYDAARIMRSICDTSVVAFPDGVVQPTAYFRSDPKTQGDLSRMFREAVQREADKR